MNDFAVGRPTAPEPEANHARIQILARDAEVGLQQYLQPLLERWRLAAACMIVAISATALISKLTLPKWYEATAVIRPVQGLWSLGSGSADLMGGAAGGILSQLASGGRSQADSYAYIAIVKSFRFTSEMIKEYHLEPVIFYDSEGSFDGQARQPLTPWRQYEVMKKRFDAEYDFRTWNITLHFDDPDPRVAQQVLADYIDRLRDKLHNQEIDQAGAAVASLTREAHRTPDALLRDKLYSLLADQVQRQLVAQVQAEFAFVVIEPPIAPDRPYWPNTTMNCIVAAMVTLVSVELWLLLAGTRGSSVMDTERDEVLLGDETMLQRAEL
jgi:uncharacterized protein involved in exopolysaccharide biosynthesis